MALSFVTYNLATTPLLSMNPASSAWTVASASTAPGVYYYDPASSASASSISYKPRHMYYSSSGSLAAMTDVTSSISSIASLAANQYWYGNANSLASSTIYVNVSSGSTSNPDALPAGYLKASQRHLVGQMAAGKKTVFRSLVFSNMNSSSDASVTGYYTDASSVNQFTFPLTVAANAEPTKWQAIDVMNAEDKFFVEFSVGEGAVKVSGIED